MIHQPHHTLNQLFFGGVVGCHLCASFRFGFCLGDVAQKNHGIFGIFHLAAHNHVADPALLAVQHDAAFLAKLAFQPFQLFCDIGAVIEFGYRLFVRLDHIVVHKELHQLIPGFALFKGSQQGRLDLEGIKGILV